MDTDILMREVAEWTNRSWLIIGLSETIIYSGENRSLDIGYLNPIGSHLEVEMNNRFKCIWNFQFKMPFGKFIWICC